MKEDKEALDELMVVANVCLMLLALAMMAFGFYLSSLYGGAP